MCHAVLYSVSTKRSPSLPGIPVPHGNQSPGTLKRKPSVLALHRPMNKVPFSSLDGNTTSFYGPNSSKTQIVDGEKSHSSLHEGHPLILSALLHLWNHNCTSCFVVCFCFVLFKERKRTTRHMAHLSSFCMSLVYSSRMHPYGMLNIFYLFFPCFPSPPFIHIWKNIS